MDEPEAAVAAAAAALLAAMFDLVADGLQFIVATRSRILLAYPGARIYTLDGDAIESIACEGDTQHVRLTRDFLAEPERYSEIFARRPPSGRRGLRRHCGRAASAPLSWLPRAGIVSG